MRIRKAKKADFPQILELAGMYSLDYSGMEADDFWVAEERGEIRGICGLKKHHDCLELCSLGVDEKCRHQGLAKQLVLALLQKIKGEIHLATIIPEFFEKFGFNKTSRIPGSMIKKSEWCAGCNREQCTIMSRTCE
jgi:N-acetylglutamate synthase-like GNAT family acetyltransferase